MQVTRETGVANEHVIVEIETDDGVPGWGEMSDLSHLPLYRFDLAQLQSALSEILVGSDPRALNQIERRMMGFYPDEGHMYSRSGLVRQGVDLAIHDCLGRADGVPVNRLLGGALRDRIPVCYPVFRLRSTDQVAAALDRVDEKLRQDLTIRCYGQRMPPTWRSDGLADRFAGRIRLSPTPTCSMARGAPRQPSATASWR